MIENSFFLLEIEVKIDVSMRICGKKYWFI